MPLEEGRTEKSSVRKSSAGRKRRATELDGVVEEAIAMSRGLEMEEDEEEEDRKRRRTSTRKAAMLDLSDPVLMF